MTGPMAKVNPFRFSTKFDDDETDFLYYAYRYYNPSTGRWISRDPLGEDLGSANLYVMLDGDAISSFDPFGLQRFIFEISRAKNGAWGNPPSYFKDSSGSQGNDAATTTLTGQGPDSSYCCNTPQGAKYADNIHAGSITVYMTDAPKGTYSIDLLLKGKAEIDKSEHEVGSPFFHAGATLRFSVGDTLKLHGSVESAGRRDHPLWSGETNATAIVTVKKRSDRVRVADYQVAMGLDKCPGVTVTAEGTITVQAHTKIK